jgi:hypothetical protein
VTALSAGLAVLAGCSGADDTNASAPPSTPPSASDIFSSQVPPPPADACPPDVNLMYEWLKTTPAIMDKLPKETTGLMEPKCSQGWSMAQIVVKNADPAYVLFKLDPGTGKWIPVAAGTDSVCDTFGVPAETQAKLGPSC